MEDHLNRDMAVFHQVCEVNDLDPKTITKAAKERFPDKFSKGQDAEKLIWTALDYRASSLIREAGQPVQDSRAAYTIDGDPAAPAFIVNEENIRSHYSTEAANKIIEALDKVKLPVQP